MQRCNFKGKYMDKILEWFGERAIKNNLSRIEQFWNGTGKCLVSITTSESLYRQLDDTDQMAKLAVENLRAQAKVPGINMPVLTADFATVTTAAYWGGRVFRDSTGENISIERAAHTVEEALAIVPKPIDDPDMVVSRCLKLYDSVCKSLDTEYLWLRPGDLQGPLNTASLIMNEEELLIEMYTKPDLIHQLLDRITDHLITYVKYTRQAANNKVAGAIWPWIFQTPEFGFGMTEDMMPLLSPDLYKEFGIPYVKRMTDALGPAQIHCCGVWGHHAKNLAKSDIAIRSMEFWYPHTKIEELEPLADKGVVFIPFIALDFAGDKFQTQEQYFQWLVDNTPDKYRFWFAYCQETPEAVAFANKNL
jgi:hypothetical protein